MPVLPSYQRLLETSRRVNWRLEDLLGEGMRLNFTRPFLPETFAQTEPLVFLSPAEKLKLNQIRARGYLALFELVETFVVPFISGQSNDGKQADPFRAPALRHFIDEEQKTTNPDVKTAVAKAENTVREHTEMIDNIAHMGGIQTPPMPTA